MSTVVRKLPVFGIILTHQPENGARTVTSDLHDESNSSEYTAAINGMEALILAAWAAGVDVESTKFLEAIETTTETLANHYE